jgi:hypothetical protein
VTLICLAVAAAVLAPYASQFHDGFEAVMERLGMPVEEPNVNPAPLGDYSAPGEGWDRARTFVAVIVGVLAVFAVTYGTAKLLERKVEDKDREREHTGSELPVPHGKGEEEGD